MLTLDRRSAILGFKATADGKESDEGEENRSFMMELSGVALDKRELCVLLSEPLAWDVLYNRTGEMIEPYLKGLKELELKKPIEGAWLALELGLQAQRYEFAEVKLSKIKLVLANGGDTLMSCKVTSGVSDYDILAILFEKLGETCDIEMRFFPPNAQRDLPLNNFGEGEEPATKPKRGRKPAARADLN